MNLQCIYISNKKDEQYEYIKNHFSFEVNFINYNKNNLRKIKQLDDENVIIYLNLKDDLILLKDDFLYLKNLNSDIIIDATGYSKNISFSESFISFNPTINNHNFTYYLKGLFPLYQKEINQLTKAPYFCSHFITLWIDKKKQIAKSLIHFKDYENMIYKVTCDFALKYNKNKEELLSDAWLGYDEALRKFDPFKGILFSTYAYIKISGSIADAIRKENNQFYKNQLYFSDLVSNEDPVNNILDDKIIEEYLKSLDNPYLDIEDYFKQVLSSDEKEIYHRKYNLKNDKKTILMDLKISSYHYQNIINSIKDKVKNYITFY